MREEIRATQENIRRAESAAREEEVVDEEALEKVFRAAGATRATSEARRALRELTERELARFAATAAADAERRGRREVDGSSMAVAAAYVAERKRR